LGKPLRLEPLSHSPEGSNKKPKEKQLPLHVLSKVFEYAVEAGFIKDGRLVEPLIEPSITDLIAEFNRAVILKMTEKMGCYSMIYYWFKTYLECTNCFASIHQFS
jgi:hypothetical protein